MSTSEQRLALANKRRLTRAQIKRDLVDGTLDPVALIFDVDPALDDFTVLSLLSFVPGLLPRSVNAALTGLGIPLTLTMVDLDAAKRADLARWLQREAPLTAPRRPAPQR